MACKEIFSNCFVDGATIMDTFYSIYYPHKENKKYSWRIYLPEKAIKFISVFDNSSSEERVNLPEFEFEVELPESYINSINIDEVKELLKDSKTLELV